MSQAPDLPGMTIEQARALIAAEDISDMSRFFQALAALLRFEGISKPRLLATATELEGMALTLASKDDPA